MWGHCARAGLLGRTATLKVKYADFQQVTRSRSFAAPVAGPEQLALIALDLLRPLLPLPQGVRLLGVSLSDLGPAVEAGGQQLALGL